jgi:superfamily II helicase
MEMLEHLSEFCEIYAYSHGIKSYIDEVLKNLDPKEVIFKDRQRRVLAPNDLAEQ